MVNKFILKFYPTRFFVLPHTYACNDKISAIQNYLRDGLQFQLGDSKWSPNFHLIDDSKVVQQENFSQLARTAIISNMQVTGMFSPSPSIPFPKRGA